MSDRNIHLLITGGMPEYLMEKIRTDGYEMKHIENPTDADLAAAEVIVGFPPVPRLAAATHVKWLQIPWSGADGYADHPDFPARIILTNATGAFGRSIAEYVFAAVFALMRRFHQYRDCQQEARWERQGDEMSPTGKKVLILGAGDIGTHTAQLFKMMGCHITGVRRVVRTIPAEFDAMITLEQVDALLPEADIVIGCMPHTPLTQGFMNRERLERMKSTAIFVNVGRGTLVDHDALADILKEGKIYGAALDVTNPEPLPADHPLWKCRNVMITPHISGQTFAGLKDKEEIFVQICKENLQRYREGKPLQNQVDLKTGYRVTANE